MRRPRVVSVSAFTVLGLVAWTVYAPTAGATHTIVTRITWGQVGVQDPHCPEPQVPETCETSADARVEQNAMSADGLVVVGNTTARNTVFGDSGERSVFVEYADIDGDGIPDEPEALDIFLVDTTPEGGAANGEGGCAGVSGDGQWAVFWSAASNLVAGDTNGVPDTFVRKLSAAPGPPPAPGVRVSVSSDGVQSNGASGGGSRANCPSISYDGRFLAFQAAASNLVAGDTNGATDIFVRDRDVDGDDVFDEPGQVATTRIPGAGGAQPNGASAIAANALSSDGTRVAFTSFASNLVAGDTNGRSDAFVHDLTTGVTMRASVTTAGAQLAGGVWPGSVGISPNGRFIGFVTKFPLVAGDTNGKLDVYAHDTLTRATARVSVSTDGTQGSDDAWTAAPTFSDDGRYVAWSTKAVHDPNDTQMDAVGMGFPPYSVYRNDRDADGDGILDESGAISTTLVSINEQDVDADAASGSLTAVSISPDGQAFVFVTAATNLFAHDHNHHSDVVRVRFA